MSIARIPHTLLCGYPMDRPWLAFQRPDPAGSRCPLRPHAIPRPLLYKGEEGVGPHTAWMTRGLHFLWPRVSPYNDSRVLMKMLRRWLLCPLPGVPTWLRNQRADSAGNTYTDLSPCPPLANSPTGIPKTTKARGSDNKKRTCNSES